MGHAIFEAGPRRRSSRDVVGVVKAPIRPGENLFGKVRVYDNRIDRNIREIAGFVLPGDRRAVCSAIRAEDVARRGGGVLIKTAYSRVADRHIRRGDGGIEGDSEDGAIR
jgi:hypothetical protein